MSPVLLLALAKNKPEVDVSAHIDVATQYLWYALALIIAFFVLRPELWRRLWFQRVDPRGAALTRIALGVTVIWTFADLLILQGEWLFTDQGLLMTDMARKNYGGKMRKLWDPEHGFEHWWDALVMLTDRWTVLFVRSDPPFVYSLFGVLFFSAFMMLIGCWTRVFTVLTWVMVLQLYNYNPIYYTGGDTVTRVMLFCAMFMDCGKAYSVDNWRRRRKAILGGAERFPAYERIAAWPMRLMMMQLTIIYCATGVLKSGKTWINGTALYYALNLDHFYRVPAHLVYAWADKLYITRVMSVTVHWWEALFPLVILGEMLRGMDRDQEQGTWVGPVPRWSLYALALAGSILMVWTAPTWARTLPLFVLATMIYVDRRWLKEPDKSGKGVLPWTIRLLSWACVLGFILLGAVFADLGVHYYYNPPKDAAGWIADKELLRNLASAATVAVPLLLAGVIFTLRKWMPGAYRFTRDWLLGKRLWLTIGFLMHLGIDLLMNVGTFVQIMVSVYPAWLGGKDVEGWWRFVYWRAAKPGEGERPALPEGKLRRLGRRLLAPLERVTMRVQKPSYVVVHGASDMAVRRAALLRCWDLGSRLSYERDEAQGGEALRLRSPDGKTTYEGARAGRALISLFPGLWWLWPLSFVPGSGHVAMKILRQRAA